MTDDDRLAFVRTVGPRTVRLRSQRCLLALILVVMALASPQAQRPRGGRPADGLIAGVGRVNGHMFDAPATGVAVMAYDYTVFAGTQGVHNHWKTDKILDIYAKRYG